jgi:uncharacterized protein YhbP (UPF0306 family)
LERKAVKTKPEQKHVAGDKIRKVYEFLQSESTLVLSTKGADGAVHSTPLFYLVAENLDLMWLSSVDSRHSQSVRVEPNVSVAVFRSTFEWRKIAGVQMHGLCSIVDGPERSPILDSYCSRFQLGSVLSLAASRSLVYRFRPQWIRYIDNQKRFGYKFELVF